jgi:transcription initiation factor TFIIIB Brf1 subunit/transcription initiation factor TFIIB
MITDTVTAEYWGACGNVNSERIQDSSTEGLLFTGRIRYQGKNRLPNPLAIHDMGFATMIGYEKSDSSGKPLSASMKGMVNRLRTWDNRIQAHQSIDRNL